MPAFVVCDLLIYDRNGPGGVFCHEVRLPLWSYWGQKDTTATGLFPLRSYTFFIVVVKLPGIYDRSSSMALLKLIPRSFFKHAHLTEAMLPLKMAVHSRVLLQLLDAG
jgi:hypothetical protein